MFVLRILGFGNNFTYWVLITAAVDILARTGAPVSSVRNALLIGDVMPFIMRIG